MSSLFDRLAPIDDPSFESWPWQFTELLSAHSQYRQDLFPYATLVIAVEAGAVNYVKRHPILRSMASSCDPNVLVPAVDQHSRNHGQALTLWKFRLLEQKTLLSSEEGVNQTH